MPSLPEILTAAVEHKASDIHLTPGCPPMVRLVGEMSELPGQETLDAEACKALIYSFLFDEQRAEFEAKLELDCSLTVPKLGRFRVNVLMTQGGVEAVLRVVPTTIPAPEALLMGPAMLELCNLNSGLVLVTGPTGSGKSTTLACLIDQINQKEPRHIITIEDPIEFLHFRAKSVVRQRAVGPHTKSFGEALRHALRQDPDVIMIGEMRDVETIALALTAAETGHLCFATLHTADAASTVTRIIDVFPAEQQQQVRVQLANTLRAVISQTLIPHQNGIGRVAAREVMIGTTAIANLIREGKIHMIPGAIETGGKFHMYNMDQSLGELLRKSLITWNDAVANARNPDKFTGTNKQS